MLKADDTLLERILDEIQESTRYRDIHPDLVRSIGAQEIQKRRSFKEALKATKNKLHLVGGAFFTGELDPARPSHFVSRLAELRAAAEVGDQAALRTLSAQLMGQHASTRERLPILEQFYSTLFNALPPVHSVLDLACGLNPLALPWMHLPADAAYYAYDLYGHMMELLDGYLQLMHVKGHAQARDVLQDCPADPVDLVLLLKALPSLEQVDKQAAQTLLRTLNAHAVIISYPVYSLGGRGKGMVAYYESHFRALMDRHCVETSQDWQIEKYSFESELTFVLKRHSAGAPH